MNVLGDTFFGIWRKSKIYLAGIFLILCTTQNFMKLRYVIVELLLHAFILRKNCIVMKFSVKLVSHWVMHFGDRNCKYRHDNLQAMFHIIWLISDCPWKQLLPSHSHREDVIIKNGVQASHSAYCIFRTVYFSLQKALKAIQKLH